MEFQWLSVSAVDVILTMLQYMIYINLSLGIFNLIPIPPLDGSKILFAFLPYHWIFKIQQYERYITIALFALLWFDILTVPIQATSNFFFTLFLNIAQKVVILW